MKSWTWYKYQNDSSLYIWNSLNAYIDLYRCHQMCINFLSITTYFNVCRNSWLIFQFYLFIFSFTELFYTVVKAHNMWKFNSKNNYDINFSDGSYTLLECDFSLHNKCDSHYRIRYAHNSSILLFMRKSCVQIYKIHCIQSPVQVEYLKHTNIMVYRLIGVKILLSNFSLNGNSLYKWIHIDKCLERILSLKYSKSIIHFKSIQF
jgi:hypothetical protein